MDSISLIKLPKEIYFAKGLLYEVSSYGVIRTPKLHWHEFYEIEYVTNGHAKQIVNGKEYSIAPGTVTLLSPVDFHSYRDINPEDPLHIINIKFQDMFLPQMVRNDIYTHKSAKITQINEDYFYTLIAGAYKEFHENEYGRDTAIMSLITYLCVLIMRQVFSGEDLEKSSEMSHSPIQEAVLYVRTHFREDISAEAVAKTVHLSPNYFSEYFKKQTGEKFSLFLLRLRVDFAANLLKITDLSVKEVAFESGFNSAAYFSNTFKDFYGMSPDRYRKINKIDTLES